jgi:uroporphyrin-3 C-methyltransferase
VDARQRDCVRQRCVRQGGVATIVDEHATAGHPARAARGPLLESTTIVALTTMPESLDPAQEPARDDLGGEARAREAAVAAPAAGSRAQSGRPRASASVSLPWLAGVAAVAVLGPLLVWLDGRQTAQEIRVAAAERLAVVESAVQGAGKGQTQLATEVRDAQAKLTLLEARLGESQAQQAALEALYRDLAPSRDEIALAEIEQALLTASQQLQLAGNVSSALTALQLAEAKLQRLDRPQFVALRRALARDVDRLRAMPYIDVAGMSLKLDQALAGIDKLPLAMDERLPLPEAAAPPADESALRHFLREAWADVRQLIRIEVADRPAAPLVPPSQQFFLRENLRLRLLAARIALLARDDASFKADLAAADAWLAQYFDTRTKPVQALQAAVKQLVATPMPAAPPDLSVSLEALRVLRLAQERSPLRAPSPR